MRIALAQVAAAGWRPELNLDIGVDVVREASAASADLVVFPELWQTGYRSPPPRRNDRGAWGETAIHDQDSWLTAFRTVAAQEQVAVVTTYLRRTAAGVSNAAAVVDAGGDIVLVHDKVHLCDFAWEAGLVPGEEFRTAWLHTSTERVRIGVMTCFDREFPESARALALQGAELIVSPNACLLCDDRIGQLRARAFENMCAVVTTNYPLPFMNGRSSVFDGVASEHGRPRNHCVVLAGPRAGVVQADVDLRRLRAYRAAALWNHARRRPGAYTALMDLPGSTGGKGLPHG